MSNNLNLKKSARNPSSIANDEHNDSAGANRSANGDIICIDQILPSADVIAVAGANVPERGTLRIANTTASWQYVFIGEQDIVPAAALDATNAIAIAPNATSMIFTGISSDDKKSLKVRASAAGVQVVVMKP